MAKQNIKLDENIDFPLKSSFKVELKKEEKEKREYKILMVTGSRVIAVDADGNGADFPKGDFVNPKEGDKFLA